MGAPGSDSPVLVTANYKLTFDSLRKELSKRDVWILVVDTRGINVWCAAGKGTFSTEEIAYQVKKAHLAEIVSHRELILPQFGAVGVSALSLKTLCGFKGKFGPILAAHVPEYLDNQMQTNSKMRTVTFTFKERATLVPIELCFLFKPIIVALVFLFFLGGIGPNFFSFQDAFSRGTGMLFSTMFGIAAGAILTPLLLPWIPGRQFWFKGLLLGIVAALLLITFSPLATTNSEALGLSLWSIAISSYLAMNFTGSTPFTSLTGVEKEMRKGLPIQIGSVAIGLGVWLIGPFI